MLGFTQYGSRLFGIDASSDSTKFQVDWPTLSPIIGAWSMTWHQCEKIVKNWHQPVKWTFFGPKLIFTISGRPNRFNGSISTSLVNLKKIGQGKILPYHVTRSHRAKLAIFKTCSDSLNMGRVCSVLMPVVTLQSLAPSKKTDHLVEVSTNLSGNFH